MAVTPGGNFYIQSSDLVANYPATSLAIANRLDKYAMNPYTDATERDFLLQTPVQGQFAQTLDDNKVWRYDGTAWIDFSGAVSAANFTDTATGTYSSGGINYKYITYTGTGTVTIDVAGFADMLLVGSGASGGNGYGGGGGAGAMLEITNGFLPAGTHTVTIPAGAAGRQPPSGTSVLTGLSGNNGQPARLVDYLSPGGGAGNGGQYNVALSSVASNAGLDGGSGGGASGTSNGATTAAGGSGVSGIGNDGGASAAILGAGAGGGGGAGVGLSNSGSYIAGAGGAGKLNQIRNSAIYLAGGGGGWGSTTGGAGGSSIGGAGGTNSAPTAGAGTVNTGSGGGGSQGQTISGAGASGLVVIRVVV